MIVHGRLRSETWQPPEGPATVTLHVDALLVGHDLNRGITHFIKQRAERPVAGPEQTDPAEALQNDEVALVEPGEGSAPVDDMAA